MVRIDETGDLDVNISNLGRPLHLERVADEYSDDQTEANERPSVARIESNLSDNHTPELSWSVTYDVGNGVEDGSFSEFIDPALDRAKFDRDKADEEFRRGNLGEAARLCQRSLEAQERRLGSDDPAIANTLNKLGQIYNANKQFFDAKPVLERALEILEGFGISNADLAMVLLNLGDAEAALKEYPKAVAYINRSITISETCGRDLYVRTVALNNLAKLYTTIGRYDESSAVFDLAIPAFERTFGPDHPNTARVLTNYASLLHKIGRKKEAETLQMRIKRIQDTGS